MGEAFTTVLVDVLSHPPERRGKGKARSPVMRGAGHGSGRLKIGRFGAQSLKTDFLANGQAQACLPIGEIHEAS
ncbi:hypothetical protein [Agrobacterium sp. V1]|uniref:hypothetical protein n=1 Tax=Agrobacterium sp. V1 TaxID=3061957 RepID=UPI0026740F14|nr:hypothetical protein [Agrobacterium sp. V1]MDO3445475.1 hypothetical protein [Agrobacterium sp. V1]